VLAIDAHGSTLPLDRSSKQNLDPITNHRSPITNQTKSGLFFQTKSRLFFKTKSGSNHHRSPIQTASQQNLDPITTRSDHDPNPLKYRSSKHAIANKKARYLICFVPDFYRRLAHK
jgi:hypothetical protein